MLHRESCLSPKLSEYCKRIGSRYFVTTSGEERAFPAFDGKSFSFDVISESLHVLESPAIGRLFALPGVQIQMMAPVVMEFVGKKGSQMIWKRRVSEFPAIPISLHRGVSPDSSVETHPDEFKPRRQVLRDFPSV